jgi:hypothetical protein
MLQVFYLDVIYVFAMAFHVFSGVFVIVLDACFKCFIYLDMYVSKVDPVLHMLQWRQCMADSCLLQGFGSYLAWRALPSPLLSSPSPPFCSLHLASPLALALGWGRRGCCVWTHTLVWMGCNTAQVREQRPDESCSGMYGRRLR